MFSLGRVYKLCPSKLDTLLVNYLVSHLESRKKKKKKKKKMSAQENIFFILDIHLSEKANNSKRNSDTKVNKPHTEVYSFLGHLIEY